MVDLEAVFGTSEFSFSHLKRVPLKPVLGGVADVAHLITGHEQIKPISLIWSLLPKDLTYQNLFIFTAAGVVPCGGRKKCSRTSL